MYCSPPRSDDGCPHSRKRKTSCCDRYKGGESSSWPTDAATEGVELLRGLLRASYEHVASCCIVLQSIRKVTSVKLIRTRLSRECDVSDLSELGVVVERRNFNSVNPFRTMDTDWLPAALLKHSSVEMPSTEKFTCSLSLRQEQSCPRLSCLHVRRGLQ